MIVGGIVGFFINIPWLNMLISICGVIVFGIYLIFDTQLILGKGELALEIDDYVFAAMNIYLDIINIFLYILEILGKD